jgi:hypothetical protein
MDEIFGVAEMSKIKDISDAAEQTKSLDEVEELDMVHTPKV